MTKSARKVALKAKKRKEQRDRSFLAENWPVLVSFIAFGLAGLVFLGTIPFRGLGIALAFLCCPLMWLYAFVVTSVMARREGHFIAFDYLESLGVVRFILVFGVCGFYVIGYAVLWFAAQVKCVMARPKKFAPWLLLQGFAVVIGVGVLVAGGIAGRLGLVRGIGQPVAIDDRFKNKDNDEPFKRNTDDPLKKKGGDEPFKKSVEDPFKKKDTDEPLRKKIPEPAAKVTGDATLDAALADVGSKDFFTAKKAADVLLNTPPNEHRGVVAKKLAEFVKDSESGNRKNAVRALTVWATPNEVPVLIQVLGEKEVSMRNEALKVLGKFQDARAVPAMVRCFTELSTRYHAERALKDMGPVAEKEVAGLLNHKDAGVRVGAVSILKDIGTQQSIPALQAAFTAGDIAIREPARKALAAINARTKK